MSDKIQALFDELRTEVLALKRTCETRDERIAGAEHTIKKQREAIEAAEANEKNAKHLLEGLRKLYADLELEARNLNADLAHERELRVDRDATIGKLVEKCAALEVEAQQCKPLREAAQAFETGLYEQRQRAEIAENKLETAQADITTLAANRDREASRADAAVADLYEARAQRDHKAALLDVARAEISEVRAQLVDAQADTATLTANRDRASEQIRELTVRVDELQGELEESREETARAQRALKPKLVITGAPLPAQVVGKAVIVSSEIPYADREVPAAPSLIDQGAQIEQLRTALKASEAEERRLKVVIVTGECQKFLSTATGRPGSVRCGEGGAHFCSAACSLRRALADVVGEWQSKVRALADELREIKLRPTSQMFLDNVLAQKAYLLAEVERLQSKRERIAGWKAERKRLRQALWQVTQHRDELQRAAGTDTATVNARIDHYCDRYNAARKQADELSQKVSALESDRTALGAALDDANSTLQSLRAGAVANNAKARKFYLDVCRALGAESCADALGFNPIDEIANTVILAKNARAVVDARDRATSRAVQAESQVNDLANQLEMWRKQSRIFAHAADTEKAEAVVWRREVDRLKLLLEKALKGWEQTAGYAAAGITGEAIEEIRDAAKSPTPTLNAVGAPTIVWARPATGLTAASAWSGAMQYQMTGADGKSLLAIELPPNCRVIAGVSPPDIIDDPLDASEREAGTVLYTKEQLEGQSPANGGKS